MGKHVQNRKITTVKKTVFTSTILISGNKAGEVLVGRWVEVTAFYLFPNKLPSEKTKHSCTNLSACRSTRLVWT